MITHLLCLGLLAGAPSSEPAEVGEIIAIAERTVSIGRLASGPYSWPAALDPADRTPYAIDWTAMLDEGEKIAAILQLTMSASGASAGVKIDDTAGRRPIIGEDGTTIQIWFLCEPAQQMKPVFSGNGVAVSVSALIRTDLDPFKEFERTAVLTVKQL